MDNARSDTFRRQMLQLAAYARGIPSAGVPDGLPIDRVQLYRRLYYNNISQLLASTLPTTHSQVSKIVWQHWIESFYALHSHTTPYFMDVAGEFVAFLNGDRPLIEGEMPAWRQLAHFEWVQVAIGVAEGDASVPDITINADATGPNDWERMTPVLSSVCEVVAYDYPVHAVADLHDPVPTLILVYRDQEERVQCMLLSPMAAQLLEALKHAGRTADELGIDALLNSVATSHGLVMTREWCDSARALLDDLVLRGVVTMSVP